MHTSGALGKLFAEVIENIDMKPVEGVRATGGAGVAEVRFGVLPQVLSNFASYALLRFEINVRERRRCIGFVGAGGIGQELIVAIRKFYYSDVSAILLMIIVCVMAIDFASRAAAPPAARLERGAVSASTARDLAALQRAPSATRSPSRSAAGARWSRGADRRRWRRSTSSASSVLDISPGPHLAGLRPARHDSSC